MRRGDDKAPAVSQHWTVRPIRFSYSLARWAGVALFAVGPLIAAAAALAPSSDVDDRAAVGLIVAFLVLAVVTAVAPARTWWIVALPVIAMALTGLEVAAGGVDDAHRVALLPLLYAATFLRLRPALPTFVGFALVTVAIITEQDAPMGVVLVDALLQVALALAISAGAETVDRRATVDRARAALAAAVTSDDVVRCLEEHVIGGEVVAAALAIVDGEPPTLAEWVADAGVAASFAPGRTIRIGPRDLISQVAIAGAVEVDVSGDSGAAAELRRRGYASALALGLPGPDGVVVGALLLGGRRAKSFRGRRRDHLERTARPLADAVTSMIQRREHEARAQFGLAARDVTTGIVAARDTDALWDAILGGLRRMLGADRAWIARRSETDPAVIVAAAAHGAPRDAFRVNTTYETSLTVVALAERRARVGARHPAQRRRASRHRDRLPDRGGAVPADGRLDRRERPGRAALRPAAAAARARARHRRSAGPRGRPRLLAARRRAPAAPAGDPRSAHRAAQPRRLPRRRRRHRSRSWAARAPSRSCCATSTT